MSEDATMGVMAKPQAEHEWLHQMLGEWTYEHDSDCGGQVHKLTGTESVRSLGGMWVLGESTGPMPGGGGEAKMLITLGYNPDKKKFVGTWVGSMMTHMWIYEGTLDESKKILTLDSEGPSMIDHTKTGKYQDIVEIVDKDHRILRSQFLGDDGKWVPFMTGHYRRKK